jgi:hypothetical protein
MNAPVFVPVYRTRATAFSPARDYVFDCKVQVGKCGELHPEEVLDPRFRRREARRNLVLDEIVRQVSAKAADISGVDQAVQAARRGCVIHRAPLRWFAREGTRTASETAPLSRLTVQARSYWRDLASGNVTSGVRDRPA